MSPRVTVRTGIAEPGPGATAREILSDGRTAWRR